MKDSGAAGGTKEALIDLVSGTAGTEDKNARIPIAKIFDLASLFLHVQVV